MPYSYSQTFPAIHTDQGALRNLEAMETQYLQKWREDLSVFCGSLHKPEDAFAH